MAVFFDATGTTATATTRPFHNLDYVWDFRDPAGGATWAYGSGANVNRKDLAIGPVAAHVFESPGTFNVCLSVSDGVNIAQTEIAIAVAAWDDATHGPTLCVENLATGTGCTAGANYLTSSDFDAAINTTAANGQIFKRILFKRGDTFTNSQSARITADGPGLIGAYGAGGKPYIDGATTKMEIGTSNGSNIDLPDWRVMDLNLDVINKANRGIQINGPARQITLLRLEIRRASIGVETLKGALDAINAAIPFTAALWSEIAIVDSIIEDMGAYTFIGEANRFAVIGNLLRDIDVPGIGGHVFRLSYTQGTVISNNELTGPSPSTVLTVRGFDFSGDQTIPANAYTEKVVISDNKLVGGVGVFPFTVRRVDNGPADVRIRNVIVERNWLVADPSPNVMFVTDAGNLTFRNNLLDITGGGTEQIALEKHSVTPAGVNADVNIYNNSIFSSTTRTATNYTLISISTPAGQGPQNLIVKNNLSYLPNWTGTHVVVGGGSPPGSGLDSTNNTDGASITTSNPNFATTPPTQPSHWRPTSGYAVDGGTAVPVFLDFFAAPRTGTYDIGAVNP